MDIHFTIRPGDESNSHVTYSGFDKIGVRNRINDYGEYYKHKQFDKNGTFISEKIQIRAPSDEISFLKIGKQLSSHKGEIWMPLVSIGFNLIPDVLKKFKFENRKIPKGNHHLIDINKNSGKGLSICAVLYNAKTKSHLATPDQIYKNSGNIWIEDCSQEPYFAMILHLC